MKIFWKNNKWEKLLFDLRVETFDITIVKINEKEYYILFFLDEEY